MTRSLADRFGITVRDRFSIKLALDFILEIGDVRGLQLTQGRIRK